MGTRCLLSSSGHRIQIMLGLARAQLSLRSSSPLVCNFSVAGTRSISSVGRQRLKLRRADVHARAKVNDEESDSKGQQLWRKELQSSNSSFDEGILENSAIEEDIQRLAKKQEVERILNSGFGEAKAEEQSGLFKVIEKILVADFFFILFILGWLVAAVVEQSFFDSSKLIDSWLPLWSSVFQPALGVFMAGAIVSAVGKKKDQ